MKTKVYNHLIPTVMAACETDQLITPFKKVEKVEKSTSIFEKYLNIKIFYEIIVPRNVCYHT